MFQGKTALNVSILFNIETDRSEQAMQTQISLLLEEQSDLGLHCLLFHLNILDKRLFGKAILFNFKHDYSNSIWSLNFKDFKVTGITCFTFSKKNIHVLGVLHQKQYINYGMSV